MKKRIAVWASIAGMAITPAASWAAEPDQATRDKIDRMFEEWRLDAHVPGLIYGIVQDGRLVAVKGFGVQDPGGAPQPVTADSLFRIASMSKAFTALAILKLRDDGKLLLDAPAETYVPEMRGWKYPTKDSRKITVRDLLNHVAGYVTDDPWGDRHQPLPEKDFSALLKAGVPFAQAPGSRMEYSNLGYATLGRIVTNTSGKRFQDYIRDTILTPLGMTSTGYDIAKSPAERRAIGYRWQDNSWVREPDMADGAFGAMGGLQTSAADYAKWVAFLLSAWPPRDDADTGPVKRATVREIVQGSNFVGAGMRPAEVGGAPCRQARAYGMGWRVIEDCDLGRVLTHGGGYPGYGSNVTLMPDKGVGVFVFTNRTYAGPANPAFKAALTLKAANLIPDREEPVGATLTEGYATAKDIWQAGNVTVADGKLALNFLMDRDAAHWKAKLADVKAVVGDCAASEPVQAESALGGSFTWACTHGRIKGRVLLAPEATPMLQALSFDVLEP